MANGIQMRTTLSDKKICKGSDPLTKELFDNFDNKFLNKYKKKLQIKKIL
jgi:hypothetical protein